MDERVEELQPRVSPLAERLGKDEYFTGAGHLNILVKMRKDIAARVPLLVLTGGEGVGKSVMAKMVATEARAGCVAVLCDQAVDSFDLLVAAIAEKMGIEIAQDVSDRTGAAIEQIAASLAHRNERLLLVCDGAERIFLATLERLRRMMDRLNRMVISMQVVLVGRPLLLDNLRQLSICDFEEIEDRRYILEPLTFAETRSYFEFCKKQMAEDESSVFTSELIEQIYQDSHGNFRDIHQLAGQLCNRYNRDASFWVLLENVEGGVPKPARRQRAPREPRLSGFDLRKLSRRQQYLAGGGVAAVLLALMMFSVSDRQPSGPADRLLKPPPAMVQSEKPADMVKAAAPEPQVVTPEPVATEPIGGDSQEVALEPPAEESLDTVTAQENGRNEDDPAAVPSSAESVVLQEEPEKSQLIADMQKEPDVLQPQTEMELDPARRQLQQAEALLSEAEQAVEAASKGSGVELAEKTAPAVNTGVERTASSVTESEALVVEAAAKKVPQLESEELPVESQAMLRPDRQKKRIQVAEISGGASLADATAAVATVEELPMEAGQAPRITAGKNKVMKQSADAPASAEGLPSDTAAASSTGGPMRGVVTSAASAASGHGIQVDSGRGKSVPRLQKAIVSDDPSAVGHGVYPARVAAGVPWLDGRKDSKYTLQLMVLNSATARSNVKDLLDRQDYAGQAGNFYIFEKGGAVPSVFVFLGEYGTVAEAQAARDQLPESLRKHQPYVLSVKEAIRKVQ